MEHAQGQSYSAFEGFELLVEGALAEVVLKVKKRIKESPQSSILIFSDLTGKEMDFDLRGTEKEVVQRLQIFTQPHLDSENTTISGPGRPKLGVTAREVSLLPRHWEWLSTQSGGASANIRRLVEAEIKKNGQKESVKHIQERTYKFLSSLAGNMPHYEEVLRALYSKDLKKFKSYISEWPKDIQRYALKLSSGVFD